MKEKNDKDENYNSKIYFYEEEIYIQLNSDYNSFINNICKIIQIAPKEFSSLKLSYLDEDSDVIILNSEEDYIIFLQQIKDKIVNGVNVEIKENSKIDPIECFGSALNYKDQIDQANKKIEENEKNKNNNFVNINNIDDNKMSNDNIINNINNSEQNINNIISKEELNDNAPIDDIIFDYKCKSCSTYPIICIIHYCPQCQLHLCDDCKQKNMPHAHHFLKFESRRELIKVKEKENIEIEEKNKLQNNGNNDKNANQNNKYNNNLNNSNNYNIFDENNQDFEFNIFNLLNNVNVFKLLRDKRIKNILKKRRNLLNNFRIAHKARKQYNLQGINSKKLLEALYQTNGDIDKAIILLTK